MPVRPCFVCQNCWAPSTVLIKPLSRHTWQPIRSQEQRQRWPAHRLRSPRAEPSGEVKSSTPGSSPTEQEEVMADAGEPETLMASLLRTSGLIAALLAVIALFLGATYVGGSAMSGLQQGFQENVTFTKKDFVPYSERRRLEAEYRAVDETNESGPLGAKGSSEQGALSPSSKKLLEELLPVRRSGS